jgi:hypothetical protein
LYCSVQTDGIYINRCISITVSSVGSHKFARRPVNKLYRNSVCITATLSAMLSGVMRGFVLLQHLPFTLATTPPLFTFTKNQSVSYPSKGPLGSVPRLKVASLLGPTCSHLCTVCMGKVKEFRYRKYFTAWHFPISERFLDIWDVTRCWVSGFRRFEDRAAFVLWFKLFLVSRALQIVGNTFFRNVGNHSPNNAT